MSTQGHQIFVDELRRFAADISDARCAAIADRLATPLRVAVSGRPGVGRSTVADALARATTARATITVATATDADLDVHVIAEVVKPEDREAIAARGRPGLVVLNKADLIGSARTHCARLSALVAVPVEPLSGLLAVAVLDDLVNDALWAALQGLAIRPADLNSPDGFIAGDHPVPPELRRRLLETLDVVAVRAVVAAIGRGATHAETCALLRRMSRIDDVVATIESLGTQVHYSRVLDAVAQLETLAITDARVGAFLARDDTVVARLAAAIDAAEAAGIPVDRCESAAAHVARAVSWQRYSRGPVAEDHRACSADIVRGSLRLWSKAAR